MLLQNIYTIMMFKIKYLILFLYALTKYQYLNRCFYSKCLREAIGKFSPQLC